MKGIDDEIEFKGFKGRYFYQLAGSVLGLLTLVFLLYTTGINSIILLFVALGAGAFALTYIKGNMEKNGKYGHIHKQHAPPQHVIINKPFHKLIAKQS